VNPQRLICDNYGGCNGENPSALGLALPAMGYGDEQIRDLEATINATDADVVVFATPVDFRKLVNILKLAVCVSYELQEIGKPDLEEVLRDF